MQLSDLVAIPRAVASRFDLIGARTLAEAADLRGAPIFAGHGVPPGGGRRVTLVGGFGAPRASMRFLEDWLERSDYRVETFCWHNGLDCGEATAARLVSQLQLSPEPAIVIAHSRGGQFARVAAAREPGRVECLITLGTPFRHIALQPLILARAAVLTALGTARVPRLARLSCVAGGCCERFRHDLAAPWRPPPPLFSIYTPGDRTVKAETCHDPAATNIAIDATHLGMVASVASFRAIAAALSAG
jgi:triacylglycerol lipase